MSFRLIALDIDGTLTNDEKIITPQTRNCLIEEERRGARIVLASARPTHGLFEMRDQLELKQYGGILMAYNGGRITDCEGTVISERGIETAVAKAILQSLKKHPVTVILDDGDHFYVTDPNGYKVEYECRNNRMTCRQVDDLAAFLCFSPAKILLAVLPEELYRVQKQIKAFLPSTLTVVRTAAFYLEIIPRAVSKGSGLEAVCRHTGIDIRNSIAFGDSQNDISMLKAAGLGIAMGNAEQ